MEGREIERRYAETGVEWSQWETTRLSWKPDQCEGQVWAPGRIMNVPFMTRDSSPLAKQVAAVNEPVLQLVTPDTVYPLLHTGWQLEPLASMAAQLPADPWAGGPDASQAAKHSKSDGRTACTTLQGATPADT